MNYRLPAPPRPTGCSHRYKILEKKCHVGNDYAILYCKKCLKTKTINITNLLRKAEDENSNT